MADSTRSGGIGFLGLLTLLFVGLKLGEVGMVAGWSWWAVLAPLWIPVSLFVVFLVLVVIGFAASGGDTLTNRKIK